MDETAAAPLTTAEQALLWRQLVQHVPGGIVGLEAVRDAPTRTLIDFRYRFTNEVALHDVFRPQPHNQHDVNGQLFSAYFPSIRQSAMWDLYLRVIDTRETIRDEIEYVADGHNLRMQVVVSPFNDGILLSYTEVDEHQRNTQALQRQSARLDNLLNSSSNAIAVFDAVRDAAGQPVGFRVSMVNQLFAGMMGQPADAFTGVPLSALYPLKADQMDRLVQFMETGEPIRQEEYIAVWDRWLDIILTRIDEGFVATLHDITGEKRSLGLLEKQARLLDGLMHTVQSGISVFEAIRDPVGRLIDYRFISVSQALLTGLGLPREQVVGQTLLTILPGMRNTTLWPIYLRVLETGVPHEFEAPYAADGYDRYFSLSVAKLNDGLVVSYANITDVKRAQLQLETLVLELRRTNESLAQFAYVTSHDLQEPLRKIVSFGDLLQQQYAGELSQPAAELVQRMQKAAGRMRILVQDLLTYSRLTGNPVNYKLIPLDELVASILTDFATIVNERRAELTVMSLPIVRGDSQLLRHLFENLLSNALKFCQPGLPPRIVVSGQLVPSPDAKLTADAYAEITVTDAGIGFDEKYLDRIFTVFQRLHGQQHYPGTGIGLAICKKVVDLHNGAIVARSQPGNGSAFTVWLPVS